MEYRVDSRRRKRLSEMTSTLTYFRQDAGRYPLLTAEEERALGHRMRAGYVPEGHAGPWTHDAQLAFDRLVNCNLRLIFKVAARYANWSGMEMADAVQCGTFGLMKAVLRYDPDGGHKFSTYAMWWIRQAIGRAVDQEVEPIRLPVHMATKVRKMRRTFGQLAVTLERVPTDTEMAAALDWTVEQLRRVRRADRSVLSLNMSLSPDGEDDGTALEATLAEPTWHVEDVAERHAEQAEDRELVDLLLSELTPREALVMRLRYGLDGGEHMTLEEVGQRLGIVRERVRQIQAQAEKKLRAKRRGDGPRKRVLTKTERLAPAVWLARRQLFAAVEERLDERERETLVLLWGIEDGMAHSARAIAERLGLTIDAIYVRTRRATAKVQAAIEEDAKARRGLPMTGEQDKITPNSGHEKAATVASVAANLKATRGPFAKQQSRSVLIPSTMAGTEAPYPIA